MRVVFGDHVGDTLPRSGVGGRLQLPPVGPDAGGVDLRHGTRHGVVIGRHVARRDHLHQQLVAGGVAGGGQRGQGGELGGHQPGFVIGVVRQQALHHVLARPAAQRHADIGAVFEGERPRARALDRPRHPPAGAGELRQNVFSVATVDDDTGGGEEVVGARLALRGQVALLRRACHQLLEAGDALAGRAVAQCQVFELRAVVEGEHGQRAPAARARRRAVQVLERRVFAQAPRGRTMPQEVAELVPARHGRRTAVARHHDRTARVGIAQRARQGLVAHPAAQQPGHEGIARAQHVEHLDRKARAGDAIFHMGRNGAFERDAAHRPALHHDQPGRDFADAPQRSQVVAVAAGDVDLFFGADDQVAQRQHLLQMRAHLIGRHVALLAQARCGEAPQHGPVIDVEHHARAGGACGLHRAQAGIEGLRVGQVGARDQQRLRRGHESRVDVGRRQAHVGALLPVEHQRKGVAVADAEEDQGREALGVGAHLRHVHPFGGQRFAHEAAVVFVAHAGQHGGLQAQARRAHRGVGRRAPQVLGE